MSSRTSLCTEWPILGALLVALSCGGPATPDPAASPGAQSENTDHSDLALENQADDEASAPAPVQETEEVCPPPFAVTSGIAEPDDSETPPLELSTPPSDAHRSDPSGMAFVVARAPEPVPGSRPSTGCTWAPTPGDNDTVTAHYSVWDPEGRLLFSTRERGEPQRMELWQLPVGWREGLSSMRLGERRIYWIPATLALRGGRGSAVFVFDMELLASQPGPVTPPDVAAPPADATTTPSGLAYKVVQPGTGKTRARAWDQLEVHLDMWNADGRLLESTRLADRPAMIMPFQWSRGWSEALGTMVVGQRNHVWMPENLRRQNTRQPGAVMIDVEVLGIEVKPDPHPVPRDVAGPPRRARKTAGGVYYRVLKSGRGKKRPKADSRVRVHYTGWTTDGAMFDSSLVRDQSAVFPLRSVIPGWTDVLQVMRKGQRIRAWIPEELAYKGQPGRPAGMLVFDIELLEIDPEPEPQEP